MSSDTALAWWDFDNSKRRYIIELFLGRMKRGVFLIAAAIGAIEMAELAKDRLFRAIGNNSCYVLSGLFIFHFADLIYMILGVGRIILPYSMG